MQRNALGLTLVLTALQLGGCSKKEPTGAPTAAAERQALLAQGDDAPNIEATAHNGQSVKLANYKGKPVVVYFYPKDDTPGCTVEAQGFRDDWSELSKSGVVVVGVSTDDNESHRAFASKYELPFLLLPDTDHRISKAFGVPIVNGHSKRVTFVIDKHGKISKVFPEVTPKDHAAEVRTAVSALEG